MNRKSKGINAERELLHKFWKNGWACIRVAGSGSAHYPSPDLIAGKNKRYMAIECKSSKDKIKYLGKDEIKQLVDFSKIFGAEPWIAIRFDKIGWYFLTIDDMNVTEKNVVIDLETAKIKGFLLEEVIK